MIQLTTICDMCKRPIMDDDDICASRLGTDDAWHSTEEGGADDSSTHICMICASHVTICYKNVRGE